MGIAVLTGKYTQSVAKALLAYNDVTIRGYCRGPQKLPKSIISESIIDMIRDEYDD
ncbi:uncharacterized protein P174DRAFT_446013 [Aspergillus novofumigatus IBT 16806]|uniref:Uncharacterized protein n=1 Tax=Aspergillus novofumigatus (strain IBT 16806) TaxID=1392255 RepID=A0A2I1BTZ7_ASPN1|nr:uncharacterized protein P174DRAFT_446013 [Aspergillus novofumigatus IBT 16806]PKX88877.1 hypothetical protein P174DRAFT_446013 [Aspergillus novofumigatus IBT 16806]